MIEEKLGRKSGLRDGAIHGSLPIEYRAADVLEVRCAGGKDQCLGENRGFVWFFSCGSREGHDRYLFL